MSTDRTSATDAQLRELTAAHEATNQVLDAMRRLQIDPDALPRLPWETAHHVLGGIWPTDIWTVCAATGNGKTQTLSHLIEHWRASDLTVHVWSLEQKPSEIRAGLAALALGYHPQWVLGNDWRRLPANAQARVLEELEAQKLDPRLIFRDGGRLGRDDLSIEMRRAKAAGASVIVLDHIHEVDVGEFNQHTGLVQFFHALKALVNELELPVVLAAQMNRGDRDPLGPYRPPNIFGIQGGEVIRQKSSVVLGLYRPLKADFQKADEMAIRMGTARVQDFVQPNAIGLHVMKHRLRGDTTGDLIQLAYARGRITDPLTVNQPSEDRYGF
jgi:replicative DNA helicase